MRVYSFLIIIIFCTSCTYFSSTQNNTSSTNSLDTSVDFSSVDVFPSFAICDSLLEKAKKTNCFRTTIHQLITKKLSDNQLTSQVSIDEMITVHLFINSKGNIIFKELHASEKIKHHFPTLDSLLKISVESLPKIYPATKRGIPVTTQYQLPIRIKLKE
ncbi:MAG: hypothetical protein ACPGTO_01320 [Polaribacter sp.]